MCLKKDPKQRPTTAQILQMDFVRQKMAEFIQQDARTLLDQGKTNLYRKRLPTIRKAKSKVEYVDKNAEEEDEPDFEHSMSGLMNPTQNFA